MANSSNAAHVYADEQREALFLDLIADLRKCDLVEVSRLTKRWGRRGVAVPTLYKWIGDEAPLWPHWRTVTAVAKALGYVTWYEKTGLPKSVLKIRRVQ